MSKELSIIPEPLLLPADTPTQMHVVAASWSKYVGCSMTVYTIESFNRRKVKDGLVAITSIELPELDEGILKAARVESLEELIKEIKGS